MNEKQNVIVIYFLHIVTVQQLHNIEIGFDGGKNLQIYHLYSKLTQNNPERKEFIITLTPNSLLDYYQVNVYPSPNFSPSTSMIELH